MRNSIPLFLLKNEPAEKPFPAAGRKRFPFLDRTLHHSAKSLKTLYQQAESAGNSSFISRLHPITKVLSFLYLVVIVSLVSSVRLQMLAAVFIFAGSLFSGINILNVYRKVLLLAFLFGFLVFAPAALNIITPGDTLIPLVTLKKVYTCWIYHIPRQIVITEQGSRSVALLFLRVFNSVSLAFLLAFTTPFPRLLKALRVLYLPNTFLMVIWLTYKFIFILCRTIDETYHALKSRLIGNIRSKAVREIVAGRIFFIYNKAHQNYEQTYAAMLSRGYEGRMMLVENRQLVIKDYFILMLVAAFGALLLII